MHHMFSKIWKNGAPVNISPVKSLCLLKRSLCISISSLGVLTSVSSWGGGGSSAAPTPVMLMERFLLGLQYPDSVVLISYTGVGGALRRKYKTVDRVWLDLQTQL